MASRQKHDPAILKILRNKGLSYDDWASEEIWKFFRSALDDKNSESRSMVLKYAEDKLKAEAISTKINHFFFQKIDVGKMARFLNKKRQNMLTFYF